ncbi:baseplate J/gp47 family protein [Clostridium tyrobutyricum]|uniref:baseplate J/gp47 family protein n=1 Tax=Clostridium tyrobutyricum TaxID=1519 RepID=UPI001C382FE7|nr:baseplate J/gp47 family protein [Clostridium tyrobutyricum]MBV4417078.1 baseplate J/gp47 family protein [Clostridium tyrobutyricum]
MYEDKTADNIQTDLLGNITDDYDKTIGYSTYDLLKSFAIEESDIYKAISSAIDMIDVDNLTGADLEKYVYQRKGLQRKVGSFASTNLTVNGTGTVKAGALFETSAGLQFACIEDTVISGSGTIPVQALEIGSSYNTPANTITEIPATIQGIISCTNLSTVTNGYDGESDDKLRGRYYDMLRNPITSNNKYAFEAWAKEVTGVGNAKCFPTWQGANTVKVVIINSNMQIANQELIDEVQNHIDPKGVQDSNGNWSTWGTGLGEASIGSYCTVDTATGKAINISATINKDSNYTDEQIKQEITDAVNKYFAEIALDENNAYVSYARIANILFNADGIKDYSNLTINNGNSNISLSLTNDLCEIPVLGDVNLIDA